MYFDAWTSCQLNGAWAVLEAVKALCADQPDGLLVSRQPAHRAGDRSITPSGGQAHHRRHLRSHLKDPARQRRLPFSA